MSMEKHLQKNAVFPFFWQYGGSAEEIQKELEKIYESHLRAFCVESRPHPDYCGPGWWRDMDLIMEFARERNMEVWVLDDDRFPTGHANKAFSDGKNQLSARFLAVHNTDVIGPKEEGYMLVKSLLAEDDEMVGVMAFQRKDKESSELLPDTGIDVTGCVKDGWLSVKVPKGLWRILVFYSTRHGNGKLDYFNICDSSSVKVLLDRVYEPHYERYREDFGKTFRGFFSDEPEFSNLPGYRFQAKLGEDMPFIPWSGELKERLRKRWGEKFLRKLAGLWYDLGEHTPHIRYEYMDETTKQLAFSFSGQIGDWCKAHGVSHIGHVVEDDNSHGRLGCSTGHYFRSLIDMRMAGIDVVTLQIMPGMDQAEHQWVASSRDGEFFHYGLAKLGSSLAHIDEKKKGDALCEIFGAFGWQEGVGLMKWLADHMLSRGVNHFVPHAFSMKPYPDPDCPPHFYAHGNHPQFEHFGRLMEYLNRAANLFQGGRYPAETAVLYHADGEWAGKAMLFQKPVRAMLEHQMDCDVIPADLLEKKNPYGARFQDGIRVAGVSYRVLVIPGCEYLPLAAARFALENEAGVKTLFVGQRPIGICEETDQQEDYKKRFEEVELVSLEKLAGRIEELIPPLVKLANPMPKLRTYPYWKGETLLIFCFNESIEDCVEEELEVCYGGEDFEVFRYDAMENRSFCLPYRYEDGKTGIRLYLEPGEAAILKVQKAEEGSLKSWTYRKGKGRRLAGTWEIWVQDVKEPSWKKLWGSEKADDACENGFPNMTKWVIGNQFCGTLSYRSRITVEEGGTRGAVHIPGWNDCADVFVDGIRRSRLVGTPMYAELSLEEGTHEIDIRLPLTPVFRDGDNWSSLTVLSPIGLTEPPEFLTWD